MAPAAASSSEDTLNASTPLQDIFDVETTAAAASNSFGRPLFSLRFREIRTGNNSQTVPSTIARAVVRAHRNDKKPSILTTYGCDVVSENQCCSTPSRKILKLACRDEWDRLGLFTRLRLSHKGHGTCWKWDRLCEEMLFIWGKHRGDSPPKI